jgi:hypothetical protein
MNSSGQSKVTVWQGITGLVSNIAALSVSGSSDAQPGKSHSATKRSIVLQFNEDGTCVQNLQDHGDGQVVRRIRSMQVHDGRLFLCISQGIAIFDLFATENQHQPSKDPQPQSTLPSAGSTPEIHAHTTKVFHC